MLDKIININSNFQYKGGGSHSPGFDKIFNGVITSRNNDSIKLSPLAQYLSRVNWQLKELSFTSKTRLHIELLVDGFEFSTEIDLNDYFRLNRQLYNIFKTFETGLFTSKILLRISSRKRKLILNDNPGKLEMKGLYRLFEKISMTEGDPERQILNLQDGIRTELIDEMEFINMVIYNLINKSGLGSVPESVLFPEDETEIIIIEKITTLHDKRFSE